MGVFGDGELALMAYEELIKIHLPGTSAEIAERAGIPRRLAAMVLMHMVRQGDAVRRLGYVCGLRSQGWTHGRTPKEAKRKGGS